MMAPPQGWVDVEPEWLRLLSQFLALRPFSRVNPAGASDALALLASLLRARGFAVAHHANPSPDGSGVLVATRPPRGGVPHTMGLFGHVDVENVVPRKAWRTANPLVPELLDGRWYARGVGDNLGPLLARLLAFRDTDETSAGVVWVIQAEEETGSPFAHALLPSLKADFASV